MASAVSGNPRSYGNTTFSARVSIGKIAEGLGFHRTYVRTRLCVEGLPNLGDSINRQALEAALAFISREPLDSAILKHCGDQAAFEYWLRQNTRTIAWMVARSLLFDFEGLIFSGIRKKLWVDGF